MAEHNEIGKEGEKMAVEFLKGNGYEILATNWRFKRDEIDIIARDKEKLVVVEVKTSRSDAWGDPEVKVTIKKQKKIVRVADQYIKSRDIDLEVRFDVVSILLDREGTKINHIEDAFYPLV